MTMLRGFSNNLGFKQLRIVLYSVLVLLVGLLVVWDFRKARSGDEKESSHHWPKLDSVSIHDDWAEAGSEIDTSEHASSLANVSYQRFKPVPEESVEIPQRRQKPSQEDLPVLKSPASIPPEPRSPLIKFESEKRGIGKTEPEVEIEPLHFPVGTMIYARILTPIYSRINESHRTIYAELTQPLIVNARTLLPAKTRLIGKIERVNDDHASFSERWEVLLEDDERKSLNALLQENDYDERTGRYGPFDGAVGLRMKKLNIDMEPEIYKVEQLVDEVVKPLAVRRAQSDILSELKLPSLDNPWTLDATETVEEAESIPEEYYIPAGTAFYLWVM